MGIALSIAGLVAAFVLLVALLVVVVFRRAARRPNGLLLPFGLSIGSVEQASNVRTIPAQPSPPDGVSTSHDGSDGADGPVLDLTGEPAALRWPEPSVWTDSTSLADAQSRPSAASNAE